MGRPCPGSLRKGIANKLFPRISAAEGSVKPPFMPLLCPLLSLALAVCLAVSLGACVSSVRYDAGIETFLFTDSAGRTVELPEKITRVAPSGSVATMILATLCPEYMVCVSGSPSSSQYRFLPANLMKLPTTGQLYGSRSSINLESLISAAPEVIIDLGDPKENIGADMDGLQKTTGIATIYLRADLPYIAGAYRAMGKLLGLEERAEKLASYIDETMAMAAENAAAIAEEDRKTVMYATGATGLNANAKGSMQAQVIEIVGAKNAVVIEGEVSNRDGGNPIDMEQLYNYDPGIIVFGPSSIYDSVANLEAWAELTAVKNGSFYKTPALPYNWMANPPSVNMVIGVRWLGNLLYPELYDYDMAAAAREFYQLFWGYELSGAEAREMLAGSTLKEATR